MSVQFEPIEQMRTPQIGFLWAEFRDRFPVTQEHPPVDPVIERFGIARTGAPEVRLQMLESPPLPRVWFVTPTGTELIQVQNDRFIHNWRKVREGDKYPRYEPIRDTFHSELQTFQATLAREQSGTMAINQCEITYVNHIVAGDGWKIHGDIGNVLTVCRAEYSDNNLREPEDVRMAVRYVLRDDQNEPVGRLHVSVQPVFRRSDNQPMLVVTLTARSRPSGEQLDDAIRCLNFGRDAIVRSFASITTPEMHAIWGRKDA